MPIKECSTCKKYIDEINNLLIIILNLENKISELNIILDNVNNELQEFKNLNYDEFDKYFST